MEKLKQTYLKFRSISNHSSDSYQDKNFLVVPKNFKLSDKLI